MIRVLLLEDERIVREGLAGLLSRQPGIAIVAAVGTANEALATIASGVGVDVIVADLMIGDEPEGIELARTLRGRNDLPAVLLLSSFGEPWMYSSALRAGAAGYVLKGAGLNEVLDAIRSVAGGVAVYPTAVLRNDQEKRPPSLREREIMRLVAAGFGNGEIGGQLGIKEKTVESHLTRLFARYDVTTRTELALLASRQGWIGRRVIAPE